MADNSNLKVPIISGINDIPKAPTTTEGGNISHFYNLFNQLIDAYDGLITNLETQISNSSSSSGTAVEHTQVFTFDGNGGIDQYYLGDNNKIGNVVKYSVKNVVDPSAVQVLLNSNVMTPVNTTSITGGAEFEVNRIDYETYSYDSFYVDYPNSTETGIEITIYVD